MEHIKRNRLMTIMVVALFAAGVLLVPSTPTVAKDREDAQALVDRAKLTLDEFMRDSNYVWLHNNLKHAKGVLIFPQVLKGGFVVGGSGGTGVFLARDEKTGRWSEPAFYTIGSATFGLQIGAEAAEVVMLAMTQKAIDSLFSSSFKLGGDVSIAVGPFGGGAKAGADVPSITADFLSFSRTKGLYAGLNLEGSVIAVRDSLNDAYCGREARPAEIIVKNQCSSRGADELRRALMRATS